MTCAALGERSLPNLCGVAQQPQSLRDTLVYLSVFVATREGRAKGLGLSLACLLIY